MNQATPSERVQLLIAGYVFGDLSADEAQEMKCLLTENPLLWEEVRALQGVSEVMQNISEIAPPPDLRSKILVSSLQEHSSTMLSAASPANRALLWTRVVGAVAAALVLILGINNLRLWKALQIARTDLMKTTSQSAQTELLIYSFNSSEVDSTVSIAVNPETLEAQLTARNLPILPSDKVYAVWTLPKQNVPVTTDSKGAILTGVFQVNAESSVDIALSVPALYRRSELIAKVTITVEDATSPQQHTGSVILSHSE